MSKEEIAARFQVLAEAPYERHSQLLREVNQDVHTKNAIKAAHVHHLRKVHLREGNHAPQFWLHLVLAVPNRTEMRVNLLRREQCQLTSRVAAALRDIECMTANVGREDLHIPCVG